LEQIFVNQLNDKKSFSFVCVIPVRVSGWRYKVLFRCKI